jgi:hypothetical protein
MNNRHVSCAQSTRRDSAARRAATRSAS